MTLIAAALILCPVPLFFLLVSSGRFSIACQRFDQYAGKCRIQEYDGVFGRIAPTTTTLPLGDIQSAEVFPSRGAQGPAYGLVLQTRSGVIPIGAQADEDPAASQAYADRINAFLQDSSADRLKIAPSLDDYGGLPAACGGVIFLLTGGALMVFGVYSLATYFLSSPQSRRSIAEIPAEEMPSSLVFPARAANRRRPDPSLYEILRKDVKTYYFSLILGISLLGVVYTFCRMTLSDEGQPAIAGLLNCWVVSAILGILIFVPLIINRLFLIKRILAEGADITGLLVRIPNSNWAKLTIAYSYEGRSFETTQVLRSDLGSPIGAYRVGDQIDLLIDKKDPRRAVLRDLWRDKKTWT